MLAGFYVLSFHTQTLKGSIPFILFTILGVGFYYFESFSSYLKNRIPFISIICTFLAFILLVINVNKIRSPIEEFQLNVKILLFISIISGFYHYKFFKSSLREIPLLKNITVATSWTILPLIFKSLDNYETVFYLSILSWFQLFLFISLSFDWLDKESDRFEGHSTIIQNTGRKVFLKIILLYLFLETMIVLILFNFSTSLLQALLIYILPALAVTGILLLVLNNRRFNQNRYIKYYLDGIIILKSIMYLTII